MDLEAELQTPPGRLPRANAKLLPIPDLPDEPCKAETGLFEYFAGYRVEDCGVRGFCGAAGDLPEVGEGSFCGGALDEEEARAGGGG